MTYAITVLEDQVIIMGYYKNPSLSTEDANWFITLITA
jgi:hypothetical protein